MEDAESIKSAIDAYMDISDTSVDELCVIVQLDFDDEALDYCIDYTLTKRSEPEEMTIDTGFSYKKLAQAWENYLDQISELHQNYREANLKHPAPEEYSSGKLGGNPAMRLRDGAGEL
ncbi:MAG: hypothetical protein ABEJ03_06085 [Candidatus Nanohaloarchaea archaeon]